MSNELQMESRGSTFPGRQIVCSKIEFITTRITENLSIVETIPLDDRTHELKVRSNPKRGIVSNLMAY